MTRDRNQSISEADTAARGPLSLLLASAALWLVVAGVLGLIHSIQRHTPSFLEGVPAFTYGRTQAMAETALIYGWAANAAYLAVIWILARLGGGPWRGLALLRIGTVFWNLVVLVGVVCIAAGEGAMIPFLQMPGFLLPILFFAGAAMAVPAILAWTGRRTDATYASQWYAVAAVFLFSWLLLAGQATLVSAPIHGIAHTVGAAWFAGNIVTLWLAPVVLAVAYYLLPRLTGRPVFHYEFASSAFWTLVVLGSGLGLRQLAGGPVPAWIPAVGISTAVLLLFHFMLVWMNLKGSCRGTGETAMSFARAGFRIYLLWGVLIALASFQFLSNRLQFSWFEPALLQLFVGGAFSLSVLGAIYELGPRALGALWPSPGQIRTHFVLAFGGLIVSTVALAAAGWVQGGGQLQAGSSFASIAAGTKTLLLVASVGDAALLLGAVVFALHSFRLIAASCCAGCRTVTAAAPASVS